MISDNILITLLCLNFVGYAFINYQNKTLESVLFKSLFNTDYLKIMFVSCILLPIIEEGFFRLFINKFIEDIGYELYIREINAVIFGLFHSLNAIVINNPYGILYQVYNATVLGYYLAGLSNIYYAILGHILFNTITLTIVSIISYKFIKYKALEITYSSYLVHKPPKRKRSFSFTDSTNPKPEVELKWLDIEDYINTKIGIDLDIISLDESFKKYNKIADNR